MRTKTLSVVNTEVRWVGKKSAHETLDVRKHKLLLFEESGPPATIHYEPSSFFRSRIYYFKPEKAQLKQNQEV